MERGVGMGEENLAVYNLEYAIYMYLRDKQKIENYKGIEFKELMESDELYSGFRVTSRNVNTAFNDILQIFRIQHLFRLCKKQNGGYQFNQEGVEFIAELLYRYYEEKSVWKDIRHVNNEEFDGFIKIYRGKNGRKLMEELRFVINGFLNIYSNEFDRKSSEYIDFESELYIATQYRRLQWIQEIEGILFEAMPFSKEDAVHSRAGALLVFYQKELWSVRNRIENILNQENSFWSAVKATYKDDLETSRFTESTKEAIEHLIEKMKDIDSEAGQMFEEVYTNREKPSEGGIKERKREAKVKKTFEKAFKSLDKTEQKEILECIFEKSNTISLDGVKESERDDREEGVRKSIAGKEIDESMVLAENAMLEFIMNRIEERTFK